MVALALWARARPDPEVTIAYRMSMMHVDGTVAGATVPRDTFAGVGDHTAVETHLAWIAE
jgi:hypothetical protein